MAWKPQAAPNGDYGKKSFMHYLLYLWLTVTIVVRLVVVVVVVCFVVLFSRSHVRQSGSS